MTEKPGPRFSEFAASLKTETAFDVLAVAQQLKANGKDVIELEIGDSPFPTATVARDAGIAAIRDDRCHYGPSAGLPEFRAAAAEYLIREHRIDCTADCIVAGPGAKTFQQLFCEAFLDPGDGVLVFSPHFPTYGPNIARRGARMRLAPLRPEDDFRPRIAEVNSFLQADPRPRAIFLNSPHNPTGGVTTAEDLAKLADCIRGSGIMVFSDEPYDQMIWRGRHHSLLEQDGMFEHCVAAYTFSKSYSMSGWRLGFAASHPDIANMLIKLTNTCLSCIPPFSQVAGAAVLREGNAERDAQMAEFGRKVASFARALDTLEGVTCAVPAGSFYTFASVAALCNRIGLTSHGLAMYLLEGADDARGVACLGGECFGEAGAGFMRFSCAEPEERLLAAVDFMAEAVDRESRIAVFADAHPHHRLQAAYA